MKRRKIFISIMVFCFIVILFTNYNNVEAALIFNKSDSDCIIIKPCDINIKVNENNSFDITESISPWFIYPSHGICRKIPITSNIAIYNSKITIPTAKITNLKVNDKFSTKIGSDYKKIMIGDKNNLITGSKDYKISYTYNMRSDELMKKLNGKDEFYFNVIGNEWNAGFINPTFKIIMPKPFDESKVSFYTGYYGDTTTSNPKLKYKIDGNIITGNYEGTLYCGQAITVKIDLPEGYFHVEESEWKDKLNIVFLFIPIILTIISYIVWRKYGKDKEVVQTVQFYPPHAMNSLDLAFAYKGIVNSNDVVSLLIYLANEGYINIIEEKNKNDFTLRKVKDYDGDNEQERLFMEGLFKFKDDVKRDDFTQIGNNDCRKLLNKYIKKIKKSVNTKENRERLFKKGLKKNKIIIFVIIVISLFSITLKPQIDYGIELNQIIFFESVLIIAIGIIVFPDYSYVIIEWMICYLLLLIVACILYFDDILIGSFYAIEYSEVFMIIYNVGKICIAIQICISRIISKRTDYGIKILGEIRGFKSFLEKCEKDKLEKLVELEPKYFYKVLPYTYVLGISYEWIEKFKCIDIQSPNWYCGSSNFNAKHFSNFISRTTSTAFGGSGGSCGGGSGGGGCAGGGCGGGGGGSW